MRMADPGLAAAPNGARPVVLDGKDVPLRVLMVTTNWPAPGGPRTSHFIKRQADFLQAAGVVVDVFHFQARKNLLSYLKAWLAVRRKLRSSHYDLIHAQFGQSGLMALPKRLPYVVTLRGSDILGTVSDRSGKYTFAGKINQRVSQMVAAKADAVILVSAHMQEQLPGLTSFHVVPSGIDFTLFRCMPRDEARRQLGLPIDKRLVLFVGNPGQARKRYGLARKVVDILNERLPCELVVAWGAAHTDIPVYMAACDALLFTSMQEGSPNVVKEALACNLPVVSVDVGDVEQRISQVEGCELCTDDSPELVASALERALLRGKRVEERESVEHLSETAITQKVISIYRSALASSGAAR